jgi:hypothetical protein
MKVTVIHKAFEEVAYTAAEVDVADMQGTEALEYAYRVTQNIDGSWSKGPAIEWEGEIHNNPDYNPNITVIQPLHEKNGNTYGLRSTSMGDEMIMNGKTYRVASFGFTKVEEAA